MAKFKLFVLVFGIILFLTGCSNSGDDPVTTNVGQARVLGGNHYTLGLWQFVADPVNESLEAVQLRAGNFHLNALPFLEPPPLLNLTLESLEFNGNIVEADIGLRHPFLGLTEFTGFDVCGILISNGSITGFSDSGLRMAGDGDTRLLNPDGYSRWWNPSEFPNNGTMSGYTDGLLGTPDSIADFNCTLNGYKFFCDDLDDPDDALSDVDIESRCIFSAGQKNVRHYTIELGAEGLIFNYAVDASWQFPEGDFPWTAPDDFAPGANRTEAWNISVGENENTLWNDGSDNGGSLSLTIDAWDHFDAGMNYILVESPGNFSPVGPITPSDGGVGYSTHDIDITNATPNEDSIELLISVVSEEEDFQGFIQGVNTTAYFIHTAQVASEPQEDNFKNIPLRESVIPFDIAIDPIDGRILIIYDDEEVWQYLQSDNWQFPNPNQKYYDTDWHTLDPNHPIYEFNIGRAYIDISDNQYFIVGFVWPVNFHIDRAWCDVVDSSGTQVSRVKPMAFWPWSYYIYDVATWGENGPYPNRVGAVWGVSLPDVTHLSYLIPSENYQLEHYYYLNIPTKTGKRWWFRSYVRGSEVDQDDTHIWVLETVDYYCARFNNVTYNNAFFGTGSQTETDDGFYNPKDLTRDNQNRLLALDILADETRRIKAFDPTDSTDIVPAESLGGFDLTEIIGPTFKIDCSDYVHPTYGNPLVVLHGDETEGYYMSIFFPDELPW